LFFQYASAHWKTRKQTLVWFLVFKFTLGKFKTSIANLVDIANDFLDRSGGDRQLEELVGYLSI
jgi:hypothetical protein